MLSFTPGKSIYFLHYSCTHLIELGSPELRPDGSRDFSIYVIDPLECTPSSSTSASDSGVAVGMGLLSSAMNVNPEESTPATGTYVRDATGSQSLQLLINLRQVIYSIFLLQLIYLQLFMVYA